MCSITNGFVWSFGEILAALSATNALNAILPVVISLKAAVVSHVKGNFISYPKLNFLSGIELVFQFSLQLYIN